MDPNRSLPAEALLFAEGRSTAVPALDDASAEDLVAMLLERGDGGRLQQLADARQKQVAKRAKKALHVLRTRGAKLPEAPHHAFHFQAGESEVERSMASLVDGRGERVVWLVRAQRGQSTLSVYQAELSETRGLLSFQSISTPRRVWRDHMDKVLSGRMAGAISQAHARNLIEEAYRTSLGAGRAAPVEFAQLRLELGEPEAVSAHPSEVITPRALVPSDWEAILALPETATWVPPEESLSALDLAVGSIQTSQLVVSPAQRRAQLDQKIERLAAELSAEFRQQVARRFRETALLYIGRGETEAAIRLVSAADACAAEDNPFFARLFYKLIPPEVFEPKGEQP